MKKLFFFFALAIVLTSCEKEWAFMESEGKGEGSTTGTNYIWPGHPNPKPLEFLGKANAGGGLVNVFDYSFRIHLDGSCVDPNPLEISRFAIPHVGPGGITIYSNVQNDATYTVKKIENGYLYYTIRSQQGHELKYNIAVKDGDRYTWFLTYELRNTGDDGKNNIITFYAN